MRLPTIAALAALLALVPPLAAQAAPVADPDASGPYAVVHDTDALAGHVVFRPADLSAFGAGKARLPIVGWVNGGCTKDGSYRSFLAEVASRGYVVVAPGGLAEPAPPAAAPPSPAPKLTLTQRIQRIRPPQTSVSDLLGGLDWLKTEGARRGGEYFGRIDASKVAVMGHSCGGMHALEASLDPRVTTTVVLASGYWRLGGELAGITLRRDMLQKLHAPVLYMLGGQSDIAFINGEADFFEINQAPVYKASREVGHGLTLRDPGGGVYGKVVIDWLDWRLKADARSAQTFVGERCGLCVDTTWAYEHKGN